MKPALPAFLTLLLAGSALAPFPGKAQTPPTDAAPTVQLPSVTVTATKERENPIFGGNPLFDQTFADLAGGPLIEAIFWRHRFLTRHPQEDAVILTTVRGSRLVSATTVYSLEGKIYASSNALGEKVSVPSLASPDLHRAEGLARAANFISLLRQQLLSAPPTGPNLAFTILRAEESGNYLALRPTTTTPEGLMQSLDAESLVPAIDFSGVAPRPAPGAPTASEAEPEGSTRVGQAEATHQHTLTQAAMRAATTQGFTQPSGALVSETYAGLHDPDHAGLVPVALGETTYRNAHVPCVFFDWDGVQYTYQPDRGTTVRSLPRNPFTDLPYLCLKNGALAECVYFSATYSRKYPGQKAVVVPGDPAFVAFQTDQNLGLFFPQLGYFTLAKDYRSVIDDRVALGKVRARIVALQAQPGAKADAIPEQMPGDDGDMQMRRAFLACQEAGLVCHLHEEGPPWFDFARDGLTYVYASDQTIHVPNAPAGGAQAAAPGEPDFKVPAIQPVQLAGPAIPDHEPEIPDLSRVVPATSPLTPVKGEEQPSSAANRIVMMPPLVVATTRIAKNPWRYVSVPGFEVLSRASDKATTWDLDGLRHGLWIQQAIIPKEWLPELPVPCTVIIDDTDLASIRADQPHSQKVAFKAPTDALAWGDLSGKARVSSEPVATDGDAFAINSNLHGVGIGGVTYASINLDRLRLGAPPLPPWVIAGLLGRNGLFREGFAVAVSRGGGGGGGGSGPIAGSLESVSEYAGSVSEDAAEARNIDRASGPGTLWISVAETQRLLQELKHNKSTRIQMLPLAALFAETPPAEANRPLWESEAGLLVRWGLMGPGHDDPALSRGFLEIVRRARQEPVTETLFTACFGFGYAAMEARLESFLKTVLAQPTSVSHLAMPATFGLPAMKTATADQAGRMIGDWLRMQGDSLRSRDPAITAACLDSAGQMLLRAYRDDNALPADQSLPASVTASLVQDPGLLAVFGLYEHDAGNDGKAREFLEAAVKASVVRPQAYQVLVELRYAEAIAKPAGTNGRISGSQATSVLEPLKAALRSPPSLNLYNLMVDTWGRSDARVASGDIDTLLAGAALFPRSTTLAFKAALVCARNGYRAQADELVRQGLVFAIDAGDRNRFERLRSILEGSPAAGSK